MHVDRLPCLPAFPQAQAELHHRFGVYGDALAVEGRLHQAALPQMKLAVACEQTMSQDRTRTFHGAAIGEPARAGQEKVFNIFGVADEVNTLITALEKHDVAIL